MNTAIADERLHNQYLTRAARGDPADVVAWLGAVQAQEYQAARWALGLRMREGTTDAGIERACDEGRILRTHVMRPTWHFVTPADIRWMLELTAPRVRQTLSHYNRRQGLDAATLTRATTVFERALQNGYLTRAELGDLLGRAGIEAKGIRLALVTIHAELEGVICSGPRRGKQPTYALVAERAPGARRLARDEALAELSKRYFKSHGPATIRDFVWWSGLKTADAKRGLDMNKARNLVVDGRTYWTIGRRPAFVPGERTGARSPTGRVAIHLLPIYDEYTVAYRDRGTGPHASSRFHSPARGTVTFQHAVVIAGQITGTWKTIRSARRLTVDVIPLRRLTGPERRGLAEAGARYGRFIGVDVTLTVA